jgi:hypothetical protein
MAKSELCIVSAQRRLQTHTSKADIKVAAKQTSSQRPAMDSAGIRQGIIVLPFTLAV